MLIVYWVLFQAVWIIGSFASLISFMLLLLLRSQVIQGLSNQPSPHPSLVLHEASKNS